ncbi:MAG TPA: protease pro-enzyme activation domain-containing protein [Ktedonobacterales bacterium]|nr:protease pro-enzyme activation domain-containing protein [Ktedonobacterales bacterium]
MTRPLRRKVAIGAVIALTVLSALVALPFINAHFTSQAASGRWTIRGHLVPAVRGRHALAQHPDNAQALDLSISLSLRNQSGLTQLIAAQNNPHSGLYHQYLSTREFQARFSPTQATVNQVTSWLRSQGLVVHSVAANHLLIDASGSVATVEATFQTTLASYQVNGRTVYAPTTEPSVPDALSGVIVNVAGLDDVGTYTHAPIVRPRATGPHVGSGPYGSGYAPTDLRTAYDMNSLISSADGTGQTVAIFELDGYKASDIVAYRNYYDLSNPFFDFQLVDGVSSAAGPDAIEVELDMEVVSAVAPGAEQLVYIGPNTVVGVNDTYNQIVTDNFAKVVSTSWGLCETFTGSSELQALDNIFQQGAAQGQAFFAASGDAGAYDCGNTSLGVDSPASDPHMVGVSGTNLQTDSGGSYLSESAWSDPSDYSRGPEGAGGGGGLSTYFAKPSYQTGPGTTNLYSNGKRQVPDVSADADPNTGYSVYCTVSASGCPGWGEVGGTSAAAPLWAGIAADLNQYLAANSMSGLGNASATLYSLFNTTQPYAPYHDIINNNNLYYHATIGYDLATGIGTPDVWNIAHDLYDLHSGSDFSFSASPTSLVLAPGSGATVTINTALTTGSPGSIVLSASVSSPGPTVSLSPTSITVGGSSTLTVNTSPSLAAGYYSVIVNGTEGVTSQNITIPVTVTSSSGSDPLLNGDFETGTLNAWTTSGSVTTSSTTHSGAYAARVGSTSPYRGNSSLSQTFTAPSGYGSLSFWYRLVCPDTVNFDWMYVTLKDNTSGTTLPNLVGKTCYNDGLWYPVSAAVTAGHSYTLTIVDHDDNYPTDPTYTLVDDVQLFASVVNPFVNPGFETNSYFGWATTGAVATASGNGIGPHGGNVTALVGDIIQYPGDSSISQTVTVPYGGTTLSFWYKVFCRDTVAYDWATATLKEYTTGAISTILSHTCTNNDTWVLVTASVIPGHTYTLTLIDHDDDWVGDPTYTFFDDVSIS